MTLLNKNQAHKNLLSFKSWEISDISIKKSLSSILIWIVLNL